MEKRSEAKEKMEDSKTDIGWGNQIRSYVMHPYKMVKDLRTRYEKGINSNGGGNGKPLRRLKAGRKIRR